MSLHSIATAGLRTVDQIPYQHDLRFHHKQNGLAITIALTTSSLPGGPVVDDKGAFGWQEYPPHIITQFSDKHCGILPHIFSFN